MVRFAAEEGLQFTAHSVGDGAVQALLDVYEEVGRDLPLRRTRPGIEHSNMPAYFSWKTSSVPSKPGSSPTLWFWTGIC
jgi:hypothetical protein